MGMNAKISQYIAIWEQRCYVDGIPDEAPPLLERNCKVPSYRNICRALMKNDVQLETLGLARDKCGLYSELKRIEINGRNKNTIKNRQMSIFDEV